MSSTKTKTNAQMLKDIRRFNKIARETRAKKLGWTCVGDLILYLLEEVDGGRGNDLYDTNSFTGARPVAVPTAPKTGKPKPVTTRGKAKIAIPVIHIVDILDASGSMQGAKIKAGVEGINFGVEKLKEDTEDVAYTYTLVDFADDIIFRHIVESLEHVKNYNCGTRGSTALFDTIGKTIEKIQDSKSYRSGDKVLVNIYTDGQENASRKFKASQIDELIKDLSTQGWTFTFIGTKQDVAYVKSAISIKDSNTHVYDGTGAGLQSSFMATASARSVYSKKVLSGEDVSEGFYKDVK